MSTTEFDNDLSNVIDSMKKMLFNRHNDIFDRLDFENDMIFLEPLLYSYVYQTNDKWLDSIIYGYEKIKKPSIEIFSNSEGIIYMPQEGYFKTNYPNQAFVLITNYNQKDILLNEKKIDYVFEPLLFLDNGMELVKYQHPLFDPIFHDIVKEALEIVIEDVYKTHTENLNKGLKIIEECNNDFYKLLKKNLKKIMLFSGEKPNSFAVMTAHNMIFLNMNNWDNEIFFADHVSHEGGHVIFNTVTYESKYQLFNYHHNISFSEVTNSITQHGTLYLRFHAFYSYVQIIKSLSVFLFNEKNNEILLHEAKGRFIFHMGNFKRSLDLFEIKDLFKPEGRKWFDSFKRYFYSLELKYNELKPMYDLSFQPYDFNSIIFEKQNPLLSQNK